MSAPPSPRRAETNLAEANPADRRALLAALRARIGACSTPASGTPARISLGHPGLDAEFPQAGLACGALHAASAATYMDQPAALGLLAGLAARALLGRPGGVIWIRTGVGFDFGAPYMPGLSGFGLDPARVLQVRARSFTDALWSAEEALRSSGVAAVVLEAGRAIDGLCARRLQLAAELGGGLGLVLGRLAGVARSRWTVASAFSPAPDWAQGHGLPAIMLPPGSPRWRAQVQLPQGRQINLHLEWRHETLGFHPVAVLADGSLATAAA